ncbi:glycosyltransferase family 4 protein [Nocardioides lijunqiniae]|uniref:glycosyltransferase family 4 protein n=1 Tax=Nocardioides lijunqiniae TaxID=2760832 RepID=UPI001877F355|nr:glycosyltransferase family 4 protein [Nocardioides lijunqiniae]
MTTSQESPALGDGVTPDDGGPRGPRVVILVDNDVRRDSRVQKQAVSMADKGWDVQVLGLAPRGEPQDAWMLGGARVLLLEVPTHRRRHEARDPRWRNPLAFGSARELQQYELGVERRRLDAEARTGSARLREPDLGSAARRLARLGVQPRRVRNGLLSRWVALRVAATTSVRQKRRAMASPVDRLTTWLWTRLLGQRSWRRLDPHLWDWEAAYGPVVDALDPDLIHANDFRMLGVGARAKLRAALRDRPVALVWDAHEYLPGARPWSNHPRWHPAQMAHEREYSAYADEVVTVSEELGQLLQQRHRLPRPPTVVLNCPLLPQPSRDGDPVPDMRALVGADDATSLLVYAGSPSRQRGLRTVVEALPELPGVRFAIVTAVPESEPVLEVVQRAEELGVADRLHLLPYVSPDDVVTYLSAADVGLIPIEHFPNHEIALITKFFEYSHARLPIVVSDVRAMSRQVRETGQGEVFRAGDVPDLVRALRAVLADPARYRAAYDGPAPLAEWTWEGQSVILDEAYHRALGRARQPAPRP